jgi:hypothetical protein
MTQPAPLVDDDTYELIDDAVAELGDRRDLFFDDASNIHLLASLIAQAERCLPLAVAEARGMERPWAEIAELLGTTEDAARARFDATSPTCDRRWPFDADREEDAGCSPDPQLTRLPPHRSNHSPGGPGGPGCFPPRSIRNSGTPH